MGLLPLRRKSPHTGCLDQDLIQQRIDAIKGLSATIDQMNEIASAIASAVEEQWPRHRRSPQRQQAALGTAEISSNMPAVRQAAGDVAARQLLQAFNELSRQSKMMRGQAETLRNIKAA